MSLVDELMKELYAKEDEANRARHVGVAQEIRIHPDWLEKILNEVNIMITHQIDRNGAHTFRGVPMKETEDVEKWEIVI